MKKYLVIKHLELIDTLSVAAAFDTYEDANTYAALSTKAKEGKNIKYWVYEQNI